MDGHRVQPTQELQRLRTEKLHETLRGMASIPVVWKEAAPSITAGVFTANWISSSPPPWASIKVVGEKLPSLDDPLSLPEQGVMTVFVISEQGSSSDMSWDKMTSMTSSFSMVNSR